MNEPKSASAIPVPQKEAARKGALTDEERRRYEALREKAEAEAMAAFDADEDPGGVTVAARRAVDGGDVGGGGAPERGEDGAH